MKMNTKVIDCKMKEIYYTQTCIKEDKNVIDARSEFWNSMNMAGIQTMSILQLKRA